MKETETLAYALSQFAEINEDDFRLSLRYWKIKEYKKGEYYNQHKSVCEYLGFTTEGLFRSYIIDPKNGEEKNVFLYSKNEFVVTFKSFINQVPCEYHTKAMADSTVVCICLNDLLSLYKSSHKWESFGRLLAQVAFNVVMERTESLLFMTPEERYLHLLSTRPDLVDILPLYHLSSYLGIQGPSLSRIRKRISLNQSILT